MRLLVYLSLLLFAETVHARPCFQRLLGWFGHHTTAIKHLTAPVPTPGVELKPAYHASPQLDLTTLDPAFSKDAARYGPGVYFYAELEHAERHANSINKGQIKKDRNKHPAAIYEAWVDVTNVFDNDKMYTRAELQKIIGALPAENLARLEIEKMSFPISGYNFYSLLSGTFTSANDVDIKSADHRKAASNALYIAGIRTILAKIPDPDTGEWHPAYISLIPIEVNR